MFKQCRSYTMAPPRLHNPISNSVTLSRHWANQSLFISIKVKHKAMVATHINLVIHWLDSAGFSNPWLSARETSALTNSVTASNYIVSVTCLFPFQQNRPFNFCNVFISLLHSTWNAMLINHTGTKASCALSYVFVCFLFGFYLLAFSEVIPGRVWTCTHG